MFTWICPQCGREVPPAYNECPNCVPQQAGQPAPPQQAAPPPAASPQQFAPPPAAPPQQTFSPAAYSAPPPVQPAPPSWMPPPQQPSGITVPPWLLSIGFAVLFLAVGAGAYFGIRYFSGSSEASTSAPAPSESAPAPTAASKAKANTLQKYVEVVGMRLTENAKKKPEVHFVVVNHSGAEIADLAANVNLWARTAKSDEEAVGTFSFKLPSIGAYESKEMSSTLNTKLRVYELPDWQNLVAEIQITSPE
jgi:hypothetical protein